MGKFKISEFFLYRWHYLIGYLLVAVGLIASLIFVGKYLPGGLSSAEIQSVIKSASITIADIWSVNVINLPYYLLQHACLVIFGVSIFSIKLPSIVLAFLSVIGLVLLLSRWFRPRVAILASLIALTTGQFLFVAQNGTPDILYLFWPIWIILLASIIPTFHKKYRKFLGIAFFLLVSLSLYTPLSFYMIFAIIGSVALHPHLRYLLKKISLYKILAGSIVLILIISPLILAIIKTPNIGLTLLGIPTKWPNLSTNLASLANEYFDFTNTNIGSVITPIFGLGLVMLIALGAYFVIRTKSTAKSYLLLLWIFCLIPVVILNPNNTTITFLPLVILMASGLSGLLSNWYQLFPKNPYARVGGLIPIIILVFIMVSSGINRYAYGYTYDPNVVPSFSKDLQLIPKDTKNIVVDDSELAFYSVISKYNKSMTISTIPEGNIFIATHKSNQSFRGYMVDRIITNSSKNDSDRFYLYKKITQ